MCRVFYIDPQSYNNLSVYDYQLLSQMRESEVVYLHNVKYQLDAYPCDEHRAVFAYSDKRGVAKGLSYVASIAQIAWLAWRRRPAVAHIQWFRLFAADALLVLLLRRIGVRVVFTAHNIVPHGATASEERHYRWYYRHLDALIVHTARSQEELSERYAVKAPVVVIPHGLLPPNVDEGAVAARADELRQTLRTEGKIVFASMGYQNRYKGIDLISDVWCEQLRDDERCLLLVVGKVQRADVSQLRQCKNVVIVDEHVPDVDFEAYLRLTTVALLPYRAISQSGVLLTCLQRGVPVVVTDVGGLTDPLRYATVGWSIGEPTRETLAARLRTLVNDKNAIEAVRTDKAAFARMREVYAWESIARKTEEVYKSIINK